MSKNYKYLNTLLSHYELKCRVLALLPIATSKKITINMKETWSLKNIKMLIFIS